MSVISTLLAFAFKRRRAMHAALLLLLAAMLLLALFEGSYSNDLSQVFPADSISGSMFRSMQDASLTQTVQLEIDTGAADGVSAADKELAAFGERLQGLRNVRSVFYRVPHVSDNVMEEIIGTLPFCANADCLAKADVKLAVKTARKMLAMPGVPLSILRSDPFGLRMRQLSQLETFRRLGGYSGGMDGTGFIADAEKRRVLFLLEADFDGKQPNAALIAPLFMSIENLAKETLPPTAAVTINSPLTHNLENEQTVRHDIFHVSLVSIVALVLLFVVFYRNAWGALWIPFLPLAAAVITAGIFAFIFNNICLFVIGICGGIAGLAVDQGIHVFAAFSGRNPLRRLRSIAVPLSCSALSSAVVFLLVCGSGIGAYIQLGLFAALTLVFNLLLSFFVLPTLISHGRPPRRIFSFEPSGGKATAIVVVWVVFIAASLCCIPLLKKDFSLNALDGISKETALAEKEFQNRWVPEEKAGVPVIISSYDRDTLLRTCEHLPSHLHMREEEMFHPAMLMPSDDRMKENLASWRSETAQQRLATLKTELSKECAAAGLPPNLFGKFFGIIDNSLQSNKFEPPEYAKAILGYLLHDTSAIAFIPKLTEADVHKDLNYILPDIEKFSKAFGLAILSPELFKAATVRDVTPRLKRISVMLLIALVIFLIQYRDIRKIIIIIIPGLTAMLGLSLMSALCGVSLNLATAFGVIMLTGLVLDYGIFALHRTQSDVDAGTGDAMVLSALTTVVTCGALLASKHPVLFHTGFVLSFGILFTALTALFVVPSLLRMRCRIGKAALLLLLAASLTGCMSMRPQRYAKREISQEMSKAETEEFKAAFFKPRTSLYTLETSFLHYDFKTLMVVKTKSDSLQAIGTASNGVTLFNIVVENGKETKRMFSSMIPEVAQKRLFGTFGEDLWCIFMDEGASTCKYGGNPLRLTEKKGRNTRQKRWQAVYYDWRQDAAVFGRIRFRNFSTMTTFTLTPAN
ncbi:MAG: hypothetical protein J5833_00990 [Victivallales bacterium]|nr:hypothetical protein [Victivallales bacterium]